MLSTSALVTKAKASTKFDAVLEDEIDALLTELEDEEELEEVLGDEDELIYKPKGSVIIAPSEFTEGAIKIPVGGQIHDFNFEQRPYLKRIYDTGSKRVLLKWARQSEKSTSFGNLALAYASLTMAFKVLYVTATAQQATVFSVDRVKDVIEISPLIRNLTTTKLAQNVFFKQFRNRSQVRIRYAFLSADRVRGIAADLVILDEIQDILTQNIPVVEQCASHSMWKLFRYGGTPKSYDNTLQVYWDQFSTQNEWVVPCDRHTPVHYNILGEKNIGKKGPVCAKCHKPINPLTKECHWVALQPKTPNNEDRVAFEGFRVPQLMVPWIINTADGWGEVLLAQARYSRARFYNEVLGLSYDVGTRPLTRTQIRQCCDESIDMSQLKENIAKCDRRDGIFVGIDWGLGEAASFTVLVLAGYIDGTFTYFFAHRFAGSEAEPPVQLEMIAKLLVKCNFKIAGCDYGIGFDRNDWLSRNFGPQKIKRIQYVGRLKKKFKWEPELNRFVVHRTEVMSDLFNAIKRQAIRLPKWEQWEHPFGEDMLNIFSEYSNSLRMTQYSLSPDKSDDTFHAMLYCLIASMLVHPRPDLIIPIKSGQRIGR